MNESGSGAKNDYLVRRNLVKFFFFFFLQASEQDYHRTFRLVQEILRDLPRLGRAGSIATACPLRQKAAFCGNNAPPPKT